MAEIHIEKDRAERIIAQVLRDEKKFSPADANRTASEIGTRLQTSMREPTKPGLRGYRMIQSSPPSLEALAEFQAEISSKLAEIDEDLARAIWKWVYDKARDLPDDVVV